MEQMKRITLSPEQVHQLKARLNEIATDRIIRQVDAAAMQKDVSFRQRTLVRSIETDIPFNESDITLDDNLLSGLKYLIELCPVFTRPLDKPTPWFLADGIETRQSDRLHLTYPLGEAVRM